MLPPIYQDLINLVTHSSLRKSPSVFMNVAMSKHCTFDKKVFRCGKVYYSNSINITNFVCLSFLIFALKISSMPTFTLKSPQKFSYFTLKTDQIHILDPQRSCPLHHPSYLHNITLPPEVVACVINLKTGLKTQGNITACCTHLAYNQTFISLSLVLNQNWLVYKCDVNDMQL
jgi:hypothetical protein